MDATTGAPAHPAPPTRRTAATIGANPRLVELSVWLLAAAAVLPGFLSIAFSGRPDALGGAVSGRVSLAVELLGLIPLGLAVVLVALQLMPGRGGWRLGAVPLALAGVLLWGLFTTVVIGEIGSIGVTTMVLAACGLGIVVLSQHVRIDVARAVIAPLTAICLASLAWLAVSPQLAMVDEVRGGLSPLPGRLAGILDHSNQLGAVSGLLLVLTVAVRPRWGAVPALVGAACLFLTESRTAWLAAGLAVAVIGLAVLTRRFRLAPVLGYGTFAVMAAAMTVPLWLDLSAYEVALSRRPALWEFVIPRIADEPVAGHGLGALSVLRDTEGLLLVRVGHAHNLLLQELFTGGAIGALLMAILLVAALRGALRRFGRGEAAGLGAVLFVLCAAPFDIVISSMLSPLSALTLMVVCMTTTASPADAVDADATDAGLLPARSRAGRSGRA